MEAVLDLVAEHETGIFFAVDEVTARHGELQTFGKTFQHFVRENRVSPSCANGSAGSPVRWAPTVTG